MSIHPSASPQVDAPRRPAAAKAMMSPRTWMAVSCLLLGISGALRYWREWQFSDIAARSEAAPFRLAELPRTAKAWQASEGADAQMDPEVARVAGSTDHIVRSYLDERSGEQATAMILYGPAAVAFGHNPEICYPAAGYQRVKGPVDSSIEVPGVKGLVHYRWAIYMKRVGGLNRYEEAFYTFRHNGEWMPDVSGRWKTFRYHPGLFKIQVSRPVTSLNESGAGPCEELLGELARQVESRLSAGGPAPAEATTATAPTASSGGKGSG